MNESYIYLIGIGFGFLLIYLGVNWNNKTCPYCKEKINKDATKCPHCQSTLQD